MPPRRRSIDLIAFFLLALALPPLAGAEAPAEHVVLISIDGLRPEFYLDPTWPAPMLRQLAEAGAVAEAVRGVFPSVTYPSHTTLITGVLPARHGIPHNAPFEPGGATGRWYWEASSIRVPTLWDVARATGLKTAALGWPVSVAAPIDWNLPEIWSLEGKSTVETIRAACTPPDLLAEIEREATGRLDDENFTIYHMTRDDRAGAAAAYLLETYRPNLLAVHLIETDEFQHEDGRDGHRVRRAVGVADRAVSQIYEAAERAGILERTAFVVTGDHGHVDRHTRLEPNVWLVEAGLHGTAADRSSAEGAAWRAAFHSAGGSAFLYLADPADLAAVDAARAALDKLPPGVRRLFRVVERDELDRLGAAPDAALALNPVPGVDLGDAATGPAVRAVQGATHGYIPDFPHIQTGLVASGAGVRRGARAAQLQMADVAALVAHLLGVDLPAVDGVAPRGFLREPE